MAEPTPIPLHRPLIGLTTSELRRPDRVLQRPQSEPAMRELALGLTYPEAMQRAGAVPVVIPPLAPEAINSLLDGLAGLVLSGGPDLDPSCYGEAPHAALGPTEQEIDVFEMALIHAAEERGMPMLCICRGMQALNVARGGTLVQDLPTEMGGGIDHRQRAPGHVPTHAVRLESGSRTAELLGVDALEVNSFHHQAVERLGRGLRAVGWAPDGVIEAVEATEGAFVVGVQWHAESLVDAPEQARLLLAFVAAAGDAASAARRAA